MEAVTMVGGAVLAPLFQSLMDALKSNDLLNYASQSKVIDELNKWEPLLRIISAVLENAELQQMTNQSIKSWFNDLRNLAYDVEDILDEFNTQAMQHKICAESEAGSSKVQTLLRSSFGGLSLSCRVKFSAGMASKVKKISERLENVRNQIDFLKLNEIVEGRTRRMIDERGTILPTTSLIDEAQVYGREKDREAILQLMKNESGGEGISVIPIVGMGGIGKTTLAQLVYNDDSLQFDFKAWVSVGEDFDVLVITKTILQLKGDEEKQKDFDSLQKKLKEKLFGKKFLIVLDDIWSENYDKWTLFCRPFAAGASGSRIIITTRNQGVSSITSGDTGYRLPELSYEDCLPIFAHHAFGRKDFSGHLHLKEVGDKIIKKCDGLPLAAKALGGLLRGVASPNTWEQVLKNNLWGEKSNILPALRVSYHYLPSHLKRCFGYCAIFPKEYKFCKDELVLLWLAEGFLQTLNEGDGYFDELLARSLLQPFGKDLSIFVMHDLVNDLARSVSGAICFSLDEEMNSRKSYAEVRHLAFNRGEFDVAQRFEKFQEMKSLRTVLALPILDEWKDWDKFYISSKVLDAWISKLKCLRVLSLSGYEIFELPKSINVLQHLRYLDMCFTCIETLPESLSELFNLEILMLHNCRWLRKLPKNFCNLINLQCLDIRDTKSFQEMPLHIGKLTKLQTLNKFIVGNTNGRRITELLKVSNLRGQLHIVGLQNVTKMEVVECTKMRGNEGIDELALRWTEDFDVLRNEENEMQVLDALQPHKNIAKISVKWYGGIEFPSWLGNHLFNNVTFLKIHQCRRVSSLPPLGQLPLLKDLNIKGMDMIREVGMEFYGKISSSGANVFPSLETLKFSYMLSWEQWSSFKDVEHNRQIFPKLKKLTIKSCPVLVGEFPKCVPSLQELVIEKCKVVVVNGMTNLESLTKLEIKDISALMSFDGAFSEGLTSLQEMEIELCNELMHLWGNETNTKRLGNLKLLRIYRCDELSSLVEGEEGIFPPNLQVLKISRCEKLERLPNQLHSLASLTYLQINNCPKLKSFPSRGLPDSVKHVEINGCNSLVSLPEGIIFDQTGNSYGEQTSCIEELNVSKGGALMIQSNGLFPASLRSLEVYDGMETQLYGSLQRQNHLSHLISLRIWNCEELESFPDVGLSIPTLSSFTLWSCRKLRCLPNDMHILASLQHLVLYKCPELVSFPKGGLPVSLTFLCIRDCDELERQPLSEWRLNALTCLQFLEIEGGMKTVSSFPDDPLLLPTSLIRIHIEGFKNLKSMSSELRRLTSLQELIIRNCPKLKYLPKKGLPHSLGRLYIWECPIMEKRCRKGKGTYWPLIAHIPRHDV